MLVESKEGTGHKLKKKWSNLKARAIAYAGSIKRIPTGGGPKEKEEWWTDSVLNIIGKDNMVITGINLQGKFILIDAWQSDSSCTVFSSGVSSQD